jgi:nicotinamidase-related amidase
VTDGEAFDPRHSALLVMDYQTGIVEQLPDADRLLARVNVAVDIVRENAGHIGWVRVAFTPSDLAAIPDSSIFAHLASSERAAALRDDAASTQIHSALAPLPGDIVVRKTRVGAFSTTDLDRQLRDRGVTTVVLAGLSTSGVVLSTVREAMDRDYRIAVLGDACADRDTDIHRFLVDRLFPAHARVTTVDQLLREITPVDR